MGEERERNETRKGKGIAAVRWRGREWVHWESHVGYTKLVENTLESEYWYPIASTVPRL